MKQDFKVEAVGPDAPEQKQRLRPRAESEAPPAPAQPSSSVPPGSAPGSVLRRTAWDVEPVPSSEDPQQMWVRDSFLMLAKYEMTSLHQQCMCCAVMPCLGENAGSREEPRPGTLSKLTQALESEKLSEMDEVQARIATAALRGTLDRHAVMQGLTLAVARMLDRQDKGLRLTAGRKACVTDVENSLSRHAGLSLAIAGCNNPMLRRFGQTKYVARIKLPELSTKHAVPNPALALADPDRLKDSC